MNDNRWQALGVWYALRPARERLILLVAAVVLLAYVWFMLAFETLEASQASTCLLYTSPSPRDGLLSRMPSSA